MEIYDDCIITKITNVCMIICNRYSIIRNTVAKKYEIHVVMSACYESFSCDQVVTILNRTSVDMKNCSYNDGFLNSSKLIVMIF